MKPSIKSLSVFLPAYNEAGNLETTVKNVIKNVKSVTDTWELIIINDGSKDNTGEIADKLAKKDPHLRVIHHNPNRGYGAALKSGLYGAKYPWVTFIDSDGQFDFSQIGRFIETKDKTHADIIIGYYQKRQVPFYRKLNTFAWQLVVYILFRLRVRDIDCGFKLISKKVIDQIPTLESERGAFISSEFLIKAQKKGFKIVEIPVTHFPRTVGQGTGANLNVIIKSFVDLFRLWQKLQS